MLKRLILRTVAGCIRQAWLVIAIAVSITAGTASYVVGHFAINTDISKLISSDLPWRQRELALADAFPQRVATILAVVRAPTPELADQAAGQLARRLSERPDRFTSVRLLGGGDFFDHNGLLFLPSDQVKQSMSLLTDAEPILATLAGDPSLRGVMDAIGYGVVGVQEDHLKLDDVTRPANLVSDTLDQALAGGRAFFSWRVLLDGHPAEPRDLQRFIEVVPVLDFGDLEPGHAASQVIRQSAADLRLASDFAADVRLTGQIAIEDEEFSTLKQGALLNNTLTILAVLFILWLALRSARIILAVFLCLVVGLVMTAALGLLLVGALNPISIAFAVLFVGIGVDFGLQFSVRYRAERHELDDIQKSLCSTAIKAGGPLALAAAATAAGFFSFLPTDYLGLSELGLIAGSGMLIAFFTSITLLPALLYLFNPPAESKAVGYAWLAPVDKFLERNRAAVIIWTVAVVVFGLPLLWFLRFDFNPINLRSPKVESVATFLELRKDPMMGGSSIEVLTPSLNATKHVAETLAPLPEVSKVMTIETFVPTEQQEKLAEIRKTATAIDPSLNPEKTDPPPSDAEKIESLKITAESLRKLAGSQQGPGADAVRRLASLLTRLAEADPAARTRAENAIVEPLKVSLDQLRNQLKPQPVSLASLPDDLKRDWMTPDGHARVEALPSADPNDNEAMRKFAQAVLAVEPNASGAAVSIQRSGDTIVRAFFEAGTWALLAIFILLWVALRRVVDVLLTLVPLMVAGVVTLEVCVLIGLQLNFANIIALPVLLGVGVAFKIYYIMAWRSGRTNLLQSTLTRAVTCSALTTATAFGSLWFSNHPGTSSMGKLLGLSLICTMAAAVLFQPVLMGPPRET